MVINTTKPRPRPDLEISCQEQLKFLLLRGFLSPLQNSVKCSFAKAVFQGVLGRAPGSESVYSKCSLKVLCHNSAAVS